MKLKYKFVVREVAGKSVAVAVGEDNRNFNGMIKLNETGEFIFKMLQGDGSSLEDICAALMKQYDIDEGTAKDAAEGFIGQLSEAGIIEE